MEKPFETRMRLCLLDHGRVVRTKYTTLFWEMDEFGAINGEPMGAIVFRAGRALFFDGIRAETTMWGQKLSYTVPMNEIIPARREFTLRYHPYAATVKIDRYYSRL